MIDMKPILFNTEMVNAILEGRKTTTIRIVQDTCDKHEFLGLFEDAEKGLIARFKYKYFFGDLHWSYNKKSKYKVGDILYVRETWQLNNPIGDLSRGDRTAQYYYKAGYGTEGIRTKINQEDEKKLGVWKPSFNMPKEASRIFLKVKSVRVERLYDIYDEGVTKHLRCKLDYASKNSEEEFNFTQARDTFKLFWNTTINKKYLPTKGWYANPWVWVIEFERISKEEAVAS